MPDTTTSLLGAVRPIHYDPDTGRIRWHDVIPPQRMADVVAELAGRDWLVECDYHHLPGSPYVEVISTPGGHGAPDAYLAGPAPCDEVAALRVQEAWPHEEHDEPIDPWEEAAAWLWIGFTPDELAAWLAADVHEPWQARALADLGYAPAQARTLGWFARGEASALRDLLERDRQPQRQAPGELCAAVLEALERVPFRLPAPTWADVTLEERMAVELLIRRLVHPRPAVARAAAEEITTLLWRPLGAAGTGGFHVPTGWWRTPLGRACARALGTTAWPPPADATALTVRDVMDAVDVDRGEIDGMLATGELRRTPDGRLRITGHGGLDA